MSVLCIKYRLYPTKAQESQLHQTLALCREVYNSMVIQRTALYEIEKKSLSRNDQNNNLTHWKAAHPELKKVHSQVLQNISERVELAFRAFFRRVKAGEKAGYPRLKGIGVYDSITFPQLNNGCCKVQGNFVQVSKIGAIPCIVHRPLVGTPKTCTIRRQSGKWFACFACEYAPEPLPESTETTGIDVGLEKFAALSDGTFIDNPRFFRKEEKALAKAQRKLSQQKKGSPSRKKAQKVISRIHERVRHRRHNFVHQLARQLVNQYGLIAVEKLNVKNMSSSPKPKQDEETGEYLPNGASRKGGLNKSILDASWSQFRTVLTQKAASAVRKIVEVNPAYTSQICCRCGNIAKKPLKQRWHFCPICSLSLDRDTNAALNILALGLQSVVG